MLCSTPLLNSFADTVSIPSALIRKLISTLANPAGIPGIPVRLNSASFLLSFTRSRSPWNTRTVTAVWWNYQCDRQAQSHHLDLQAERHHSLAVLQVAGTVRSRHITQTLYSARFPVFSEIARNFYPNLTNESTTNDQPCRVIVVRGTASLRAEGGACVVKCPNVVRNVSPTFPSLKELFST